VPERKIPSASLSDRLYWSAYTAYHRRGQGRYPFRPLAQIERDRDRRVAATVAYAYRWVPYYRETLARLGLSPSDFRTAADLSQLPLLQREQLQRDPEYFVSRQQPLSAYRRRYNSGSTGTPCVFYNDPAALCYYAACHPRIREPLRHLLGRLHGYKKTGIWSRTRGRTSGNQLFYGRWLIIPSRLSISRQVLSLFDPPEVNVALVNEFQPDVLEATGSYLAVLFNYLSSSGAQMHRPKALVYTFDSLPEPARRLIDDHFGIPIFGTYEGQEATFLAFECEEHTGYHTNIDLAAVRIVDEEGQTLPDGEPGNVVVSNLILRGTVLLNYMMQDVAAWSPGDCACGRTLPRLERLVTRLDDWLELPSGLKVHPRLVPGVMLKEDGIWQYQVTQESPSSLKVALVCAEDVDREAMASRLQERFKETILGNEVDVRVVFVADVERTLRGKVRPVISLQTRDWLDRASQEIAAETRAEAP
jgi:phenylacetate-CoA ligase